VVFHPARMTARIAGRADWLYAQFYRLDRILAASHGFMLALACALVEAGLTYRYDNKREGIVAGIQRACTLAVRRMNTKLCLCRCRVDGSLRFSGTAAPSRRTPTPSQSLGASPLPRR